MPKLNRSKRRQLLGATRKLLLETLEDRRLLTAGLEIVKDIHPNPQEESGMGRAIQIGGHLYFPRSSEIYGWELWKSDGTPDGTKMVKDIFPGSAWPSDSSRAHVTHLTNVDGVLFFRASDGNHGFEIWKSDGTAIGTQLVKDIRPGAGDSISSSESSSGLTNVNGILFFAANDGTHGLELWRSDGTEAGTVMVKDIAWGVSGSNPRGLINVNGTLYFEAIDGTHGRELWKSDGTPEGTVMVRDIKTGGGSSRPVQFRAMENVNGILYFQANDGTHGYELWRSDGTEVGTWMVKDIRPNVGNWSSEPGNLINVNGTLFFSAHDGVHGYELWKSDGTPDGTVLVKDIRPGSGSSYLTRTINVNGTLFFAANDGSTGYELWKSDGTAAGTMLVKDIRSGIAHSRPERLTSVGSVLYFEADDGNGTRLWKTDGTTAGTTMFYHSLALYSSFNPVNVGGVLYFSSLSGIWKSDGTVPGTVMVRPNIRENAFGYPQFGAASGTVFFRANNGVSGHELWKTDGTSAGTALVKDINPGVARSFPTNLVNVNGTMFFQANDGTHGYELWKSDGTTDGTAMVKDIDPGFQSSVALGIGMVNTNGVLYFGARDSSSGSELWKSDGTAPGTVMVKDIRPGPGDSYASPFAYLNGVLYLSANDGTSGRELWKSDGTANGTVLVKDIRPGGSSSNPAYGTEMNGILYFMANDGTHGEELWRSDGSASGTSLVKDIRPGAFSSSLGRLVPVNDTLFFTANDGTNWGLWKSDGTSDGTVLIPGTGNMRSISHLTNIGGILYFSANDGIHGEELWTSDGTEAGTQMVFDLTGDSGGSNPRVIADLGDEKLLVLATTATYGRELYVLNLRGAAPPTVTGLHVRGSGWNQNYLDMLEASGVGSSTGGFRLIDGAGQLANSSLVTWQTINQISASFSQPVVVASEALRLLDSTNSDLPLAVNGFNYDPVSLTASWTLAEPLPVGKYLIVLESPMIVDQHGQSLDGEFIQSQDTFASSGDGSEGGDFYFRFNYLPGDVTRNAQTNQGDANLLRSLGTVLPSSHNYWQDVTGNHQINAGDANYVLSLGTLSLSGFSDPAIPPPARSGRGSTWDAPEEDQGEEENEHRPVTEASVDDGWLASHTPALTPVVIEDVERKACRIEWLPLAAQSLSSTDIAAGWSQKVDYLLSFEQEVRPLLGPELPVPTRLTIDGFDESLLSQDRSRWSTRLGRGPVRRP